MILCKIALNLFRPQMADVYNRKGKGNWFLFSVLECT